MLDMHTGWTSLYVGIKFARELHLTQSRLLRCCYEIWFLKDVVLEDYASFETVLYLLVV